MLYESIQSLIYQTFQFKSSNLSVINLSTI